MGRSGHAAAALASGVAAAVVCAACGLDLEGLGDVVSRDASTGADVVTVDSTVDVGVPESAALDAAEELAREAGHDSGVEDARPDRHDGAPNDAPSDACDASAVEICSDGVDNNCNGLVDCADPQCASQGYVCTPAVPPGWELVGYTATSRPACPSGWGGPVSLVEGPDGGGTCQCTCGTPFGNPCLQGTASMSLGQNACGCSNVQNVPLVSDGGCNPIGAPIGQPCGAWGDGNVKPIAPGSVACSQTTVPTPVTFVAQGQTCVPLQDAGAGCTVGWGCYPQIPPASACIEAAGFQVPCPAGFPNAHDVYEQSNVIDERQCGSCGCTSSPASCTGAKVTLFDDPACSLGAVPITANGSCNGISGDPSDAGWFVYSATPGTTACSGSSTTIIADAGLLLRGPATICCP